jgi:hypothetical protein
MSERERPRHSASTTAGKAARQVREAQALRENLQKRKAQQRGRQEDADIGGVKPLATSDEARLETVRPKPYKGT